MAGIHPADRAPEGRAAGEVHLQDPGVAGAVNQAEEAALPVEDAVVVLPDK